MSVITVNSLTKSFGHIDIFSGISFSIPRGARLALVGPNGCGKTTLLRMLIGEEEISSGSVTIARNTQIGYLPQEAEFDSNNTVWEECLKVFEDLIRQQEGLHRLEAQMAAHQTDNNLLERYGQLQHGFELDGGYTYQTRIKQVLSGLGFSQDEYQMPVEHLSGGQRTRAFLARLLLAEPDLLLLDEPTNHLDIQAVEWLENYLAQWSGAVLIVSHDRYFLDRVATVILEMNHGASELYRGNYSAYLQQRENRWLRREQVFQSEQEKLLKEALYIKKNIAGQNVSQARGRLRRLSRTIQAIEQIGLDAVLAQNWSETAAQVEITTSDLSAEEAERRVRALRPPRRTMPKLNLRLRSEKRSGDLILRCKDLQIGYPGNFLFRAPDFELRRTECAALIGPNGAGKSTFLKSILGQLEPLAGTVDLGASLEIGYFAQAHEGLDPRKTVVEEIMQTAPQFLLSDAREYLGKYLFSGEDAFKRVDMLSGGERGRLALAKLALTDTNLLLLDEPTNHLDIISQEVLQAVLDTYAGTILLVSHDRYLIDALATQIWEIKPDESELMVFNGTYSQMKEYFEKKAAQAAAEQALITTTAKPRRNNNSDEAKAERKRLAKVQELENLIAKLETQLAAVGRQLENPPADPEAVTRLGQEYTTIQQEMDKKLLEWENLNV